MLRVGLPVGLLVCLDKVKPRYDVWFGSHSIRSIQVLKFIPFANLI